MRLSTQGDGSATPCFCTTLLEEELGDDERENAQRDFDIRWTANSMYSGSSSLPESFLNYLTDLNPLFS